jgi:hypothetical protein
VIVREPRREPENVADSASLDEAGVGKAAAQPIAVAAGAEVGNISFTMQSAPAFRVSGIVVDENGDPVADAMVMMMGDPRSGIFMGPGQRTVAERRTFHDRRSSGGKLPADGIDSDQDERLRRQRRLRHME